MAPPDIDQLEKIHNKLNRKLAKWEKQKLKELTKSLRAAETEINALLTTVDGWVQIQLNGLTKEIDRILDKLSYDAEQWVLGNTNVAPSSPLAPLAHYPILTGGGAGLAAVGAVGTFTTIHIPVLWYLQDYQLGLIKRVTQEIRDQIKEELKRGYIMGESSNNIAKRLRNTKLNKGVWPSVEKRAEVIARTEILRASNQGALYVYQQYDVKRVMWLTAADERVCGVCGPLHRRIFPIGQIPFGGAPAHPRCRCFIVPHIVVTADEGTAGDITAKANVKWWKDRKAA